MSHNHHHHGESTKNLKIAFYLNLAFTLFEIIGGLFVNSIAIISDAIHDLGDTLSIGTALYLEKKSIKPNDKNFSFGYKRFSLLGAVITGLILLLGSIYVVIEAIGRIIEPEHSDAEGMLFFSIIGVLVNGYAAWKVSKGKSINEKMVSLHLLEDVLGWVAILIVSIVLLFKDIHYLDPALSLIITLYILWNVIKRLKKSVFIFLQGVPLEIDKNKIENEILKIDHVNSLHHTRIWSLDGEHHVFTTHVKLNKINSFEKLLSIKNSVKEIMKKFPFEHYTIETEVDNESCDIKD